MTRNYIPADDPGKLRWLINFNQWFQGNLNQRIGHMAAVKQVTTVHHCIHLLLQGGLKCQAKIRQEIKPPAATVDTRFQRKIQTDMCVG